MPGAPSSRIQLPSLGSVTPPPAPRPAFPLYPYFPVPSSSVAPWALRTKAMGSPPSSSSSCFSSQHMSTRATSSPEENVQPSPAGQPPTLFSLECPLLPSFSLNILPTSSIGPSQPPEGMPTSSRSSVRGDLHTAHILLCAPFLFPTLPGRAGVSVNPQHQHSGLPRAEGQRGDLWRCRGACWRVAPPPPKALPDQVEGRRIDSPEGPSLPPSLPGCSGPIRARCGGGGRG